MNPFSLSFLDLLCCALGGLLFLLIFYLLQSALSEAESPAQEEARKNARELAALAKKRDRVALEVEALQREVREKRALIERRAQEDEVVREAWEALRKVEDQIERTKHEIELIEVQSSRSHAKSEALDREIRALADRGKRSLVRFLPERAGGSSASEVHHVVVGKEELVIHPGGGRASSANFLDPSGAYRALLVRLASEPGASMVLWFRPSGFEHFAPLVNAAAESEVRFGWEPAEESWEIGEE